MLENYFKSKEEFEDYLDKTYDPVRFMQFLSLLLQGEQK